MNPVMIVTHTPLWVFAMLALLVFLGVQATRTREVRLLRLFITPVIFIGWGLLRLGQPGGVAADLLTDWAGGALVGAALGLLTARVAGMQVHRNGRRVQLPGSWFPLVRNLAIFCAKYGIAVALATHAVVRSDLLPWDFAISGVSAGYFAGWLVRFALAYRSAPEITPVAA